MTYQIWWDENVGAEPLRDVRDVEAVLDPDRVGFGVNGGRSFAYFVAPDVDGEAVLRVDVDHDGGRAAVRWLPDGSYGIEVDSLGPIEVWEACVGVVVVSARLVRVSVGTARRAVAEYMATGQRPTCLAWSTERIG